MTYEITPQNHQLLLEKFVIEQKQEISSDFFIPEEYGRVTNKCEIFKIINCYYTKLSPSCSMTIGDIIIVENYSHIGTFNGKEYFIAHENSVLAKIIKK